MKITLEIYAHTNLDDMRSALGKLDGKLLRRAVAVTVAVRPGLPDLGGMFRAWSRGVGTAGFEPATPRL